MTNTFKEGLIEIGVPEDDVRRFPSRPANR